MSVFSLNSVVRPLSVLYYYPIHNSGPLIQTVRWIKPRFRPIAKSKMFRVREPTPVDPKEHEQLQFLNNVYKTHMRSVRTYFLTQLQEKMKKAEMTKKTDFSEDIQEFEQLLKENDLWNEQVRMEREADMALAQAETELSLQKRKERFEQRKLARILEAEERIFKDQDTIFITEENLDIEIEKVMDASVDFNFAIDKQGIIIKDETKTDSEGKNSESEPNEKSLS